jgi:hypothetical protein
MHDYSIDKHPKEKVIASLAFVALILAPPLNQLLQVVDEYLPIKGIPVISAVSLLTVFAGVYWLFNKHLWRWRWLRDLLLVPDLNGAWECAGTTRMKDGNPTEFQWSGDIVITQSWSRLLIHLKTKTSSSHSVAASISRISGVGYKLIYQYENDPTAEIAELKKHDGTCELVFPEDLASAEGKYFTDRHRMTVGDMTLTRKNQS